jgi:large subunit ribosomal protein L22
MKAVLKNYRQSPRKVRLVTDAIKGHTADKALVLLAHMPKQASHQVEKLLRSALANAGGDPAGYVVKDVHVDEGVTLKRIRPAARGSAHVIRKRTSRVTLALEAQSK